MKLIKGLLAVAIVSLIAVSCNETKKEVKNDAQEVVESGQEKVADVVGDKSGTNEPVEADAKKVSDSVNTMAEGKTKKCEGKCSKDEKSCDGSCKA